MIWRPVLAGLGTLKEVQYDWDIDDLFDSMELLDLKESQEAEAHQKAQANKGQGR